MERVARHILLSSPPGQFDLVLSDLKVLIPLSILSPAFCADIRTEYDLRSGSSLLSSNDDSRMNDNRMNDDDDCEFGPMLQSKLNQNYISSHFHNNNNNNNNDDDGRVFAKCQVVQQEQQQEQQEEEVTKNKFQVTIYAQRVNLKNYHAGSWKTTFEIETTTTDNNHSVARLINGVAIIRAHTFENGNVQLSSNIQLPTVTLSSTAAENDKTSLLLLVDKIIQELQKWDNEYILQPIHELYHTISEKTLKTLRRIMPVTRTKFDWNVASHRFVNTLSHDVIVVRQK